MRVWDYLGSIQSFSQYVNVVSVKTKLVIVL